MENKKNILVISLLFLSFSVKANFKNYNKSDSLFVSISKEKHDTNKADLLNKIFYDAVLSDLGLCKKVNYTLYVSSKKKNYHQGIGYYYFNAGEFDFRRCNLEAALGKLSKYAAILRKTNSREFIALAQCSIETLLVILHLEKEGFAIISKIAEKIINKGRDKELSYLCYFYGNYYHSKNDIPASISYFNKALINAKKVGLSSIFLDSYVSWVDIFVEYKLGKFVKRYSNFQMKDLVGIVTTQGKALPINKANDYINKSNLHKYFSEDEMVISLSKMALKYAEESKNIYLKVICLNVILLIQFILINYQDYLTIGEIVLREYDQSDILALQMLGNNYFIVLAPIKREYSFKKSLFNKPTCNFSFSKHIVGKYIIYNILSNSQFSLKNYKGAFEFKNIYVDSRAYLVRNINSLFINIESVIYESKEKSFAMGKLEQALNNLWNDTYIVDHIFLNVVLSAVLAYTIIKNRSEFINKNIIITELEKNNCLSKKSLRLKNILLRESHHRVKNNFQLIISLLNIEVRQGKGSSIYHHIEKLETRIGVLVSLYDSFSKLQDNDLIYLKAYVEKLVAYNLEIMGIKQISVEIKIVETLIDIETATSLGLIINELICNSLKHAFPQETEGKIVISIKLITESNYAFHYCDNGVKEITEIENKNSLGLKLIRGLVEQIKGSCIKIGRSHGFIYEFNFKNWS